VVQVKLPNLEVLALAQAVNIAVDFALGHEKQKFEAPGTLEPATHIQLGLGGTMSGVELQATNWIRGYAVQYLQELFKEKDLSGIFTPTLASLPPRMPASAKTTGESNTTLIMKLLQYIFLGNLCGHPCISIPAGLSKEGLPVAVQVIAKHWDEHVCLRLANAMDEPQFRSVPPGFVDLLRKS